MSEIIPESVCETFEAKAVWRKRELIQNLRVVCHCYVDKEKKVQMLAHKSSPVVYVCGNIPVANENNDIETCGFRVNASTMKFIRDYKILKQNEIKFPVCVKCGMSWLLLSESQKMPNYMGNLGFTCTCLPYQSRINFPVGCTELEPYFDTVNWLSGYEAKQKLLPKKRKADVKDGKKPEYKISKVGDDSQ